MLGTAMFVRRTQWPWKVLGLSFCHCVGRCWACSCRLTVTFIIAGGSDQPVLVLNFLVSTRLVGWQGCCVAKSSLGLLNIDEQGRPGRDPYFSHLSDAQRWYPAGRRQKMPNPRHLDFIDPGSASSFSPINPRPLYEKARRGKSKQLRFSSKWVSVVPWKAVYMVGWEWVRQGCIDC